MFINLRSAIEDEDVYAMVGGNDDVKGKGKPPPDAAQPLR